MKTFKRTDLNNAVIRSINGINAKEYIRKHTKQFITVPFDFMYDGLSFYVSDFKRLKLTRKLKYDGTHIYWIGEKTVWQLEQI